MVCCYPVFFSPSHERIMQSLFADRSKGMRLNDALIDLVAKAYHLQPGQEIGIAFLVGKPEDMVVKGERIEDGVVVRVRVYKKLWIGALTSQELVSTFYRNCPADEVVAEIIDDHKED